MSNKPLLLVCHEESLKALSTIEQVTAQYKQARELFNGLAAGEPTACDAVRLGAMYLQPTNGDPIQLPVPPDAVVQTMLAESSTHFNNALRNAWATLAAHAAKALQQLDTVAVPATPPAEFDQNSNDPPPPPLAAAS
jgi:hypothetical protein